MPTKSKNFNFNEIKKFNTFAKNWWNPNGEMKVLHKFNPIRVEYIKEELQQKYNKSPNTCLPLKGLSILDVGCGGGILSESLAKLGADVTGIDKADKMIDIAKKHATDSKLDITYECLDLKDIIKSKKKYDVITCLEVIEHVNNPEKLISNLEKCLKKNGSLFLSTINRTYKSYLGAIITAEYILKWLPTKTHNWNKFLKPSEIIEILNNNNIKLIGLSGICYNILTKSWYMNTKNLDINFIIHAKSS